MSENKKNFKFYCNVNEDVLLKHGVCHVYSSDDGNFVPNRYTIRNNLSIIDKDYFNSHFKMRKTNDGEIWFIPRPECEAYFKEREEGFDERKATIIDDLDSKSYDLVEHFLKSNVLSNDIKTYLKRIPSQKLEDAFKHCFSRTLRGGRIVDDITGSVIIDSWIRETDGIRLFFYDEEANASFGYKISYRVLGELFETFNKIEIKATQKTA